MNEQTQGAQVSNPFDPDSFSHGGGLWDGKTVTITEARVKTEALKYGDGRPVTNDKGEQSVQTALVLKGIAEGGDDKERSESYSGGDKLMATSDGEGFIPKDGGPLKFHANSNIAKFSAALKAAGFDIGTLLAKDAPPIAPGVPRQQFSKLVGARFVFKGEPKIGKDGKPIKDKKGYDKNAFYPVRFVGYAQGSAAHAGGGNGAATANGGGSALETKATAKIVEVLSDAGKPVTKADLIRLMAQKLVGDSDNNGIIALVARDDFHRGKPWTYDGKQASI